MHRTVELIREYEPPSLCHFEALAAVPAVLGTAGGAGAAAAGGGFLSSILPAVGAIGSLGGTVLSAKSGLDQADYENKVAQANNVALQAKANQDAASAQRQEVQQQRQTQLALSREQALAGASGGSATDPTVLNLSKQIVQQGGYNALSAAYNGQAAANADTYQFHLRRLAHYHPDRSLRRAACIMTELLDRLSALQPDQIAGLLAGLGTRQAPFTPLPGPQSAAYESLADELLFGGAAGGSKSCLLLGCAATRHQRSLILRRQSTELDGLESDLCGMLGHDGYNKSSHEHTGAGRSVRLGGCREPDDWRHYAGRARDFMGFDEAGEFLEEQVASLLAWLRSTDPNQRCRVIFASNPPRGPEGEWLLQPWLDPAFPHPAAPGELRWYIRAKGVTRWVDGPGRIEVDGESYTPRSRTFIPARLSDNPFLDTTNYRASLENLPEPLRSQLLKGDFLAGREDDAWQVIPAAWVEAAQQRWTPGIPGAMDALGVDVAQGGSDATVLAPRHGRWFAPLKAVPGRQTPDGVSVASLVFGEIRDGCMVVVDLGGGWGGEAYGHLTKHLPDGSVIGFMGVNSSTETTATGAERFVNLRAQAWWRFREALDPQTGASVALPPDPALAADLAMPRWKMTSRGGRGAVQIEAKDEIRKRLGRSPDRADAVVMAWAYGGHRPQDADWTGPLPTKYGRAAAGAHFR